jgi:hypothetical protein
MLWGRANVVEETGKEVGLKERREVRKVRLYDCIAWPLSISFLIPPLLEMLCSQWLEKKGKATEQCLP